MARSACNFLAVIAWTQVGIGCSTVTHSRAASPSPASASEKSTDLSEISSALAVANDALIVLWGAANRDRNGPWLAGVELTNTVPVASAFLRSPLVFDGFVGDPEDLTVMIADGTLLADGIADGHRFSIRIPVPIETTLVESVVNTEDSTLTIHLDLPQSLSTDEWELRWSEAVLAFDIAILALHTRSSSHSMPVDVRERIEAVDSAANELLTLIPADPPADGRQPLESSVTTLASLLDDAQQACLESGAQPPSDRLLSQWSIPGLDSPTISTDWLSPGLERLLLSRRFIESRPRGATQPIAATLDGSEDVWIGFEDLEDQKVRITLICGTTRDGQITRNKLRLQTLGMVSQAGLGAYLPIDYVVDRIGPGRNSQPVYIATFTLDLASLPNSMSAQSQR